MSQNSYTWRLAQGHFPTLADGIQMSLQQFDYERKKYSVLSSTLATIGGLLRTIERRTVDVGSPEAPGAFQRVRGPFAVIRTR
jgi:hypothetical protein